MNRTPVARRSIAAAPPPARPTPFRGLRAPGFSLLELMVTVAVAAIVIGLGAPSMSRLLTRHAVVARADEMLDALRAARAEAMSRGGPVILCRTERGSTARCATDGSGNWQTWMVFADADRSGGFDAGDPVVRAQASVLAHVRVTTEAGVRSVRFEPTGIARPGNGARKVVFLLGAADAPPAPSSAGERSSQRQVCLGASGDAAVIDGNGACP